MFKIFFLLFLFKITAYAENFDNMEQTINIKIIFLLGSFSVFIYFYWIFFYEKKNNYSTFQIYSKYLLKEMNFSNYNSESYIKDIVVLKNQILKKLVLNNVYYIIYNKSTKAIVSTKKLNKEEIDTFFTDIKRSLYSTENSISFFSLPTKEFYVNYKFYFLIKSITSKYFFYSIKELIIFVSIFSLLSYSVLNSYIYEMIQISGIPLSLVEVNLSILVQKIFTDIFLSFSLLLIFNGILVGLIVGIFIIFIISYYIKKYDFFFLSLEIFTFLNTILLFFIVFIPLVIFFFYKPILSLYKIQVPKNESIKIDDINISIGDYIKFKEEYRILEKNNRNILMVAYDNHFIFYYDVEENKNILLSKEIELVHKKEEFNNCSEIINNLIHLKRDKDFQSYKLDAILINNKILNSSFLKRLPLEELSLHTQKSVNLTRDLKVNEIINKCEIIVNLKDEKVNYESFESMNNQELIKWIDKLEYLQKEKIKEVRSRIENEIEEDKKNTK